MKHKAINPCAKHNGLTLKLSPNNKAMIVYSYNNHPNINKCNGKIKRSYINKQEEITPEKNN